MAVWTLTPVSRLLAAGCGQVRPTGLAGSRLEAWGVVAEGRVAAGGAGGSEVSSFYPPSTCSPSCPDGANRNGAEGGSWAHDPRLN